MSLEMMLVVLFSALLHAGWNALVRSTADKFAGSLAIALGAGTLALPLLPVLPLPAPASWPYLLASGLIHVVYFALVAWSYRHAELSLAYPLMRGSAPALTAVGALLWLGESPTSGGWLGVALIGAGGLSLASVGWRTSPAHARAVGFALANAGVIALYTVIDGQGARLSGHAFAYTGWALLLTALFLLPIALLLRGRALLARLRPLTRTAMLGGGGSLTAYALVLWAMGHAPIASVAALRESSIVFAALIGALLLGERISRARALAITLVCAGAAAIKLS